MDINYELYKVFYYVATTLSFSEASRQLYISQSAVSQSVKVLEKKLGKQLFLRSTKKVQLTPEGEILLRHVEPAMNLIMRGESQLLDANPLSGGQLRIGASDTICRHFLIPYLSRFHREHPNIHIKVTNSTSIGCVDLLENGQADLIVVNYPNSRLTNLVHRKPLRTFQDVFVASRRFFDLENVSLSLKDLQNYPILMLDRKSTTSEYLHQLFQQHQLDLVPEIESSFGNAPTPDYDSDYSYDYDTDCDSDYAYDTLYDVFGDNGITVSAFDNVYTFQASGDGSSYEFSYTENGNRTFRSTGTAFCYREDDEDYYYRDEYPYDEYIMYSVYLYPEHQETNGPQQDWCDSMMQSKVDSILLNVFQSRTTDEVVVEDMDGVGLFGSGNVLPFNKVQEG